MGLHLSVRSNSIVFDQFLMASRVDFSDFPSFGLRLRSVYRRRRTNSFSLTSVVL